MVKIFFVQTLFSANTLLKRVQITKIYGKGRNFSLRGQKMRNLCFLIYANFCSFFAHLAFFKQFSNEKWPNTIPWTSNFDKYIHLVSTKLYEWKLMVVFLIANLLLNFSPCNYVRRFFMPMHWLGWCVRCLFH